MTTLHGATPGPDEGQPNTNQLRAAAPPPVSAAGIPAQPAAQAGQPASLYAQPVAGTADVQRAVLGERRTWRQRFGKSSAGGAVASGIAAAKFGTKGLLLLKSLGVLVKFKTVASMLISIGVYAIFWGWRFAAGFVLLILVHELGHVVVLRAQGVKASAPMFIPLLGAFVTVQGVQRSVAQEATSALAGPAVGALGAAAVFATGQATGSPLLLALAYTGFFINLFNLIPALPLDGGRVAGAVHPAIWLAGMAGAIGLLIFRPSLVAVLILVMGGAETVKRWRARRAGKSAAYHDIPAALRWRIGGAYLLVAAVCAVGMYAAYLPRPY